MRVNSMPPDVLYHTHGLTGFVAISFNAAVSSARLSISTVYTYGFPMNISV